MNQFLCFSTVAVLLGLSEYFRRENKQLRQMLYEKSLVELEYAAFRRGVAGTRRDLERI